jgi:hypothetical protein
MRKGCLEYIKKVGWGQEETATGFSTRLAEVIRASKKQWWV